MGLPRIASARRHRRLRRAAALGLLVALAACKRAPAPAAATPAGGATSETPVRGGTAVVATVVGLEQVNELIDNGDDFTTEVIYRLFLKLQIGRASCRERV